MALSKLFLLSDKRVDNLLVIGFNPSHTNINNDVNAPLKILATLIRCLDNELAGSQGRGGDSS
jgi:importin-9